MNNIFKNKYPLLNSYHSYSSEESESEKLYEEYKNFLSSKKKVLGNIEAYFGGRLHDSLIRNISHKSDRVSITINEFASHCFADALEDKYHFGVTHKNRIFPIEFSFSKIEHFSISWINKNSKILPLNKQKYIPKLSELLSDQIIALDEKLIEVGFMIYSRQRGNKSNLILQIKAEKVEINEHQRDAFKKLYNSQFLDLFDLFWEKKQQGQYFDFSVAKQLIEEKT